MGHDPNSNRMFTKDLGCTNQGCKCQSKWLILWKDGEIVESDTDDNPQFLIDLNEKLKSKEIKKRRDGSFVYRWEKPYKYEGVTYQPSPLDIVEVNGKTYFHESCESFGEVASCARELHLGKELKGKPDGYYVIVMEFACYSSYNYEYGYEGDNDYAFVILNEEPIPEDQIDSVDLDKYEIK